MFDHYLALWHLTPDGEPIITPSGQLLPVRQGATPAMLKVATEDEEKFGGLLMAWWEGDGAARVLAQDSDALLLERAEGTRNLVDMVRAGYDDEASCILCEVIGHLHAPRNKLIPEVISLTRWFRDLVSRC